MNEDEIIVDSFAGGGGASTGIESAGYHVAVALNHDPEAIAMHRANHPGTHHLGGDIRDIDPRIATGGRRVGLLWASPDCTHHSKAKGSAPRSNDRRGLADVVVTWAQQVKPRVIMLENVEEFQDWGPLDDKGRADRSRRGDDFRRWVGELQEAGYVVEWRLLSAHDYGAPTSRRRLFLIARRDGHRIVWPEPTHGRGRIPYRTAAECIEWNRPCWSIFGRTKPLVENTQRRIARGMKKFVLDTPSPYVVNDVAFTMIHRGNGERPGQAPRIYDLGAPLTTVVACGQKHALVACFMAKHYGGHEGPGASLQLPMSTITTQDYRALVAASSYGPHEHDVRAFITRWNGIGDGQPLQLPLGTVTTRDRFGLVQVWGHPIADIGIRMLAPRELFRAQGFPDHYKIDVTHDGAELTQTAQVRMAGNSVSPVMSRALVAANLRDLTAVVAA